MLSMVFSHRSAPTVQLDLWRKVICLELFLRPSLEYWSSSTTITSHSFLRQWRYTDGGWGIGEIGCYFLAGRPHRESVLLGIKKIIWRMISRQRRREKSFMIIIIINVFGYLRSIQSCSTLVSNVPVFKPKQNKESSSNPRKRTLP